MRFEISLNRATGRRVQYVDGTVQVTQLKKGMLTDEQQKLVAGAKFQPEVMLAKIEAMVRSGKVDAKELAAVLDQKPDFDALARGEC
jgi:hypothetical protein